MKIIKKADLMAARLAAARSEASLERADFCIALADLGLLSAEECVRAAQGHWPDGFQEFLMYLTEDQARNMRTSWAGAVDVRRMDAAILSLAWWFKISDEVLDAMFGVKVWPRG